MGRLFYEEKQKVPALLVWLVVVLVLGMITPVLWVIYRQVVLDQDTGADITKLTLVVIGLALVLSFVIWLVASLYLEIRIGPLGIDYGYHPHYLKPRHVDVDAVASYVVRDVRLKDYFHSSLDRRLGSGATGEVFTLAGSTVVEIYLRGGERIVLGTENKESLTWAMKKLLEFRSSHG